MSEPVRLQTRVERAWARYIEALNRAQQTQDIRDGIDAGRAWADFMAEFDKPERRR